MDIVGKERQKSGRSESERKGVGGGLNRQRGAISCIHFVGVKLRAEWENPSIRRDEKPAEKQEA